MIKKITLQHWPYLLGLICGMYFFSLNALGFSFDFFPGDFGDARFNNYLLEHAHQFFIGNIKSYWDAPFMYPEAKVISYSDNLLGSAPFYSLFRLLSFDRETSFQLWFLLMSAFNYSACYFFLRYVFKNNFAAVCGAMIFAFSIALYTQIGHAQTFPRYMVPLALWMALLYLKELRVKYFFLMILFLVYQIYCGIYLGFMLAVPVGLIFLVGIFFRRGLYRIRIKDKRWWMWMMISSLVNILLLLPLMLPYIERAKQTGFYEWTHVAQSLPTPVSYVFSHHGSLFWDCITGIAVEYPAFWDHKIFPGAIALLCFVFCILLGISKLINRNFLSTFQYDLQMRVLFVSGLLTFLFFLRIGDFSLYKILYHLPGFGSMRALQRIINIELVFMAAGVAFLSQYLFRKRRPVSTVIFIALLGLIILDNRIKFDAVNKNSKVLSQQQINSLIEKINLEDPETILSYEPDSMPNQEIHYQIDAMLAAQTLKIKTLNGYSATAPNNYAAYWQRPREDSRIVWLQEKKLSDEHIQIVK